MKLKLEIEIDESNTRNVELELTQDQFKDEKNRNECLSLIGDILYNIVYPEEFKNKLTKYKKLAGIK